MSWRQKEPGHQQWWYLQCWTKLIQSLYYHETCNSCTLVKKKSRKADIHHAKPGEGGIEAIKAYMPQYLLCWADWFLGCRTKNSAECWNSYNIMHFVSCTCISTYLSSMAHICTFMCIYTHLYTLYTEDIISIDASMYQISPNHVKRSPFENKDSLLVCFLNEAIAQFKSTLSVI